MVANTIIMDHGSGLLKAGLSGWNEPQMVLPSIVNYMPCKENPGPSSAKRRVGLGIDILRPNTFSYPVQRGQILNWEGVEHIWMFVLDKHRQEKEDFSVVITESPLSVPADRRKTLEIMFELLGVSSLLLADQMEMSLYASGLLTGMVVDSGFGLTRVQPFLLGCPLTSGRKTLEFAGQDISTYLFKSLFKDAHDQHNTLQLDTVNTVQVSRCYVPNNLAEALDLKQNLPSSPDESDIYYLPDGTAMNLTPLQRQAPEMLFSPQKFDMPGPSISQVIMDSMKAFEASQHHLLLTHVMACGGNSLYPGFCKRLCKDLTSKNHSSKINVWMNNNRQFSVWLGASVVAHLSTYRSQWMSKAEYFEGIRM